MPWPSWSPDLIRRGFPKGSLLEGTEPAVWSALGNLPSSAFRGKKQGPIRSALQEIGLGWVATNTTPFRVAVGALYDAAESCHEKENNPKSGPKRQKKEETSVKVKTNPLPECPDIKGPLKSGEISSSERQALWKHLSEHGACVIRGAVSRSELKSSSLPDPTTAAAKGKQVKLAETTGSGKAGDPTSFYVDLPDPKPSTWRYELEAGIWDCLLGGGAEGLAGEQDASNPPKRKSILLCYGEGSENWAHQDNNDDAIAPVQALFMLSEPGKSFQGGQFYVAKQEEQQDDNTICVTRNEVTFESPGDLVIFQAGKASGYWHGMMPVNSGTKEPGKGGFLREAVGMLQPV